MPKRNEIYISVDVETSGPIPGVFSLLSLGACVVGEPNKTFYAELKPLNDNFIKKALMVNGLSLEKLKKQGEAPIVARKRFENWINEVAVNNRPVFVGFNATFDWMFTHWYFLNFLGNDPFGISGLDIKAYYAGMQKTTWQETTKKQLCQKYPPKTRHTHNALDDAIEQAEIFEKMLRANK